MKNFEKFLPYIEWLVRCEIFCNIIIDGKEIYVRPVGGWPLTGD